MNKSCIKIRKSGLYVSGKLAGRVTNEVYHSNVSLGVLAPQLCHLLPKDTAQPPSSPPPAMPLLLIVLILSLPLLS